MRISILTAPPELASPVVLAGSGVEADAEALSILADGLRDADLAAPPVVLPDFHHKQDMEMPSSIAVATRETIRPTLTSSSVNCGMALVGFDAEPPSDRAIERFFSLVRRRFPYPPTHRRDLTVSDVIDCVTDGARFAVDRFDVDPAELERMEEGGMMDVERYGDRERIRRALPQLSLQLSRMRFGTVGPSNHFVELQVVEEILDEGSASRLGVRPGQMTLQYHGGGGVLAGQVGRLFGRRRKASRSMRLQMAVTKPIFHLASARSVAEFRQRISLYFSRSCPPVPRKGPEGERLLLANAAAMNYGFAFRMATYAALRRLANQAFGPTVSSLVVDSPHNSIYEEQLDGDSALVHRHNACRAFPASKMAPGTAFGDVGQALLLPGLDVTSSYLCVADEGSTLSLHSACHGAGTVIEDMKARGLSALDPAGHTTLRFGYSDAAPARVAHSDDRGIDAALSILRGHRIVRPVARMRPLAVLK